MVDPVAHCAVISGVSIYVAPGRDYFFHLYQSSTVSTPPSASDHTAIALLHKLSSEGFPAVVIYPWLLHNIQADILQGPYVSTKTA